jgi:O-antigen ligase
MNARSNPARASYPLASSSTYPRSRMPSQSLEYGYYLSIFYMVMSPALGLSVSLLGAAFLAALAGFCFRRVGRNARVVFSPLVFPSSCAASVLLIHTLVHGDSILQSNSRNFITWILALVVVQSLVLRPGFLRRFAIALFLLGLCMLPYMNLYGGAGDDRFGLEGGVAFGNPNDLAAFFGFCCLYFTIAGIETRQLLIRAASWLAATVSLYVVGLTVSRGPLFALAVALVVGARRFLKRGFIPMLLLVLGVGLGYISGLFDQALASYQNRLTVDTGRLSVWPAALERFENSPWFGVGISDLPSYVPGADRPYMPHNGFLCVGLAGGVVPLLLFVGYWWRSGRLAFAKARRSLPDGIFCGPLWLYAFLVSMQLDFVFMAPWVAVILANAMSRASGQPASLRWRANPMASSTRGGISIDNPQASSGMSPAVSRSSLTKTGRNDQ